MNTAARLEKANRVMKVRGEPTAAEVPDAVSRPDSYNRDMIHCLNWYNSHVDQNKMRSICEQRVGQTLKNASNNDVMQLGALIRMGEQGAIFTSTHTTRIASLESVLVANEVHEEPVERVKSVRVDQSKIALSQIDAALDDFITTGKPLSIDTILSQFKFNREEQKRVNEYLARVNEQYQEAVTAKDAEVKNAWSHISLKNRKELVEATNILGKKTKIKTVTKPTTNKETDQIIAVNAKHGIVQVINGSSMKMVGKSVKGFDEKTSYMVRVKGVSSSSNKNELKKMIKNAARMKHPVTGRLGQLWVIV